MKIRRGFVSNSSSSSFIVAANKENTKITITLETDLTKYGKVLTTAQEVEDYFIEKYGDGALSDVAIKKEYSKCVKEITAGNIIIVGAFNDDSEDVAESILCSRGIPKNLVNIKIIQNEGGY